MACVAVGCGIRASAQQDVHTTAAISDAASAGPQAIVTRDADGQVTVRATRIAEPLVLDGRLDEAIYERVPAISNFIQQEPFEGQPATENTEAWVFFDDKNIYVSARCWDSQPEREVSNEMRRDSPALFDNELFGVAFDTFHDRRNAFMFAANLSGGLSDAYITDERDFNRDWNTVWNARTARFEGGWTIEIVIPFKSLRYTTDQNQTWGINFRRNIRWKNEADFLTQIPAALGRRGMNKVSSSATLVGLEVPKSRRNVEFKPYGIADVTTDRLATLPTSNALGRDMGLDVKVGLTQGLTADLSYNTDFAQVEVDEQQVNLTRFNVLFPEKRDFFLEGQGIFAFGGVMNSPRNGIGPGGNSSGNPNPADMPNLFFSRQIGLINGQRVPIEMGARVSGKTGRYSIGLLDIRTGREDGVSAPSTAFGVVRIKRDVLRRSAIGALFTHRSMSSSGQGSNQLFGVDGVFSFYENVNINAYLAKANTEGAGGHDLSYRAQLDYNADRYGLQLEHMFLDDRFVPDIGFVRRTAFRRDSAFVRFSPRPRSIKAVRKLIYDSTFEYITDTSGKLQSRNLEGAFRAELQNGDSFAVEAARLYEFLPGPFAIAEHVTLPEGAYPFAETRFLYYFGPQRPSSGIVKVLRGSFYNGTRTEITTTRGRIEITPEISVEPGVTLDLVDLPEGSFTNTLVSARTTYTLTPRTLISALTQYNSISHTLGTNFRFRWEYTPGSDLFVVYNDNRDTRHVGFPMLQSRSFVVKFTHLFRL